MFQLNTGTDIFKLTHSSLQTAIELGGASGGICYVRLTDQICEVRSGLYNSEEISGNADALFSLFGRDERCLVLSGDQSRRIHGNWIAGFSALAVVMRGCDGQIIAGLVLLAERPWKAELACSRLFPFIECFELMLQALLSAHRAEERFREAQRAVESYKGFISVMSEGVWRFELPTPVSTQLGTQEQIDLFLSTARLVECNSSMARMYGFDEPKQIIGVALKDLFSPNEPQNRIFLESFIQSGYRLQNAETIERDRRGGSLYFLNSLIGLVENGYVLGAWGIQQDISKYRDMERRLTVAASQAADASQAKSKFVANISHEMRTPLGVILGFADLALDTPGLPPPARGYVDSIKRNAGQLSDMVGGVLDMSKIEASRMDVESISCSLTQLMGDVVNSLSVRANEKGLFLKWRVHDSLPDQVKTDPSKLRQILINLVSNSIKFTQVGGVELSVMPMDRNSELALMDLEFLVRDTGIGIAEHIGEKLFEAFTQAEVSTSRKYGGTGLGLTVSRKMAEALNGKLTLHESQIGFGSTFRLVVPVQYEHLPAAVVTETADNKDYSSLQGKRILVVEDSEDNQILIRTYLSAAGVSVDMASNGQEGIQKAESGEYDLVVMDIQMPGVDGHQATQTLRRHGFCRPIIALTANALKEDRERALESGFNDYLTKPINRVALLKTLKQRI